MGKSIWIGLEKSVGSLGEKHALQQKTTPRL
jgi:hypothetical protein